MSTREYAASIFNRLTEKQLERFISLFTNQGFSETQMGFTQEDEIEKRLKIFSELKENLIPIPDLDEQAEKDEYFKEKYGL